MKFPPGYGRTRLPGTRGSANMWRVVIGGKSMVLTGRLARNPGSIRKRIETVLGLEERRTVEQKTTDKIRTHASKSFGGSRGGKKRLHTPVGWLAKGRPPRTAR